MLRSKNNAKEMGYRYCLGCGCDGRGFGWFSGLQLFVLSLNLLKGSVVAKNKFLTILFSLLVLGTGFAGFVFAFLFI